MLGLQQNKTPEKSRDGKAWEFLVVRPANNAGRIQQYRPPETIGISQGVIAKENCYLSIRKVAAAEPRTLFSGEREGALSGLR